MKKTLLISALAVILASGCSTKKVDEPTPGLSQKNNNDFSQSEKIPSPPPPPDISTVPTPGKNMESTPDHTPPPPPEPPTGNLEAAGGDVILEQGDEAEIRKLFLDKYEVGMDEVKINVTKMIGTKARGNYAIKQGDSFTEPKLFLTAKVIGKWRLVHDDDSDISCVTVSKYGFAAELVPECKNKNQPDTSASRNPPNPS